MGAGRRCEGRVARLYDLKIINGLLLDGTGAPGRLADVAVTAGVIVAVGDCPGPASRTIDAEGCIVTPGFVDIHTHYDGQVTWDPDLMPSSIHGVTTAVMGNCGVGFAPVREADRARLIELMEGVEDIPGSVLTEGLKWDWQSFPEFMDSLDRGERAIDIAVQVPHDALRVYVMGDRAIRGEQATDDDITAMRTELREALEAGAVGFSTGRTDNHRAKNGSMTPGAEATAHELGGIAGAFAGLKHGVLMAVSDYDMEAGPEHFDREFDVVEHMAACADGHTLSLSVSQRDLEPGQWKRILARAEVCNANGLPMRLQVAPRGIGVLLGFEATFHPFMGFPSYKRVAHLPLAERVLALSACKAQLLSETSERLAGDGSSVPPLADRMLAMVDRLAFKLFRLGEQPSYEPTMADSLGASARRRGVKALEEIFDAMLEDDGRALLYFPVYNYQEFSLDVVRQMITHPLALPGLSDGGAHAGTICDASFPTFLLTWWARDRAQGQLPIERVVQMLTHDTAKHMGFHDRGEIRVGLKADLNVIDHAGLTLHRPELVADLPAGGRRLLQRVTGYRATVVSGEIISENGILTGRRPGRLVRLKG